MSDFLQLAPPDERSLHERLGALLGEGLPLSDIGTAQLLGVEDEQHLRRVCVPRPLAYVHRNLPEFGFWTQLNWRLTSTANVVLPYHDAQATEGKALEVAQILQHWVTPYNRRVAFIGATDVSAPLFGIAPDGWLSLLAPIAEPGAQRQRLGNLTVKVSPLSAAPEGWEPLESADMGVVGWLCPERRRVRLRFHPFIAANGRFSTARPEDRAALLRALLELIIPRATGARAPEPPSENLLAWQQAYQQASELIQGAAAFPAVARAQALITHRTSAQQELQRLERQLVDAVENFDSTQMAAELELPTIAQQLGQQYAHSRQIVEQVRLLPGVAQAELRLPRGRSQMLLYVHTYPHNVMVGAQLCAIEALKLTVPLYADTPIRVAGAHPRVRSDGQLQALPQAVAFARAMSEGRTVDALRLVLAALVAPLSAGSSRPYRRAEATAQAGYVIS